MSANVATNFPPQTYSSQFFLNTINDDVGPPATSSKKRSRNSAEGAESSNAVLDCFISTMHTKTLKSLLIFGVLLLQISFSTAQKKYTCTDGSHTTIRTFKSIVEFQHNSVKFSPNNNFVSFETLTISRLQKNDFISYDSNHIRKLILNDKRIELIDNETFNELFCVQYLLLQDNLISVINNGTFIGLYNLQVLNLSGNGIKEIPIGTFWNLKHLFKLDLSHNNIKNLYDNSFQYLRSLWDLRLDYNQIHDIPYNLFSFSNHLHSLYLGNNKIIIPVLEEYKDLTSLDVLDLQNNQIKVIGKQAFFALEKLSDLNLYGNQIKEFNISELPQQLEKINIAHNLFQCTYLKDVIQQLHSHEIDLILNDEITQTTDPNQFGCYNGSIPYTPLPTSTTEKPYFTKPPKDTTTDSVITIPTSTPAKPTTTTVGTPDFDELWRIVEENRGLHKSVSDLKTSVIILIIIIVMFHVIDIIIRTNTFERCKARFQRREQVGMYRYNREYNFPLMQR